jgi:hypothetical protein
MKFIIHSQPRAGSAMLRTCISAHPELTCLWELYNGKMKYTHELRDRVGHYVQRKVRAMAKAAFEVAQGFTVHGGQQNHGPFRKVLDKLIDEYPDLRVLFLVRRDAFAQAVSYMRARRTKRWGLYHFRKDKVTNRDLKPMDFKGDMGQMVYFAKREFQARRNARRILADQLSRTVVYEDMCGNLVNEMFNTFRFLGKEYVPVKPETMKQAAAPLRKLVVNYDKTRQIFEKRLLDAIGTTTLDVV